MGLLPGRDRKVVGIKAPSTKAKAKKWINSFLSADAARQRKFLGRR